MESLRRQWEQLPQWQKYILLFLLPILAGAYVWMMLVSPNVEKLESLRREKAQLEQEIKNLKVASDPRTLENLKKREEEMETQLRQKQAELEAVVGQIPTVKDGGSVIRAIGQMARSTGVVILSVNLSTPQKTRYVLEDKERKKVTVVQQQQPQQQQQQKQQKEVKPAKPSVEYPTGELKLVFEGTPQRVRTFLTALERGGVVSYPQSLSLSRGEKGKVKGELTIKVIFREEEKL
ncbi:hypothetical protein Thal_0046 [Thermocrinis albus DSM 14484]|uniref:Uncharacterized protein n=1 Tax=Thermocrinis albus (strain DSM 14484 / JCM 11386 / HI 11/12) TaxID=638303 RepID=D3SNE7_THEAH|nr:hypothetical protein [Thermocrinis albus]ADC88684.1 hypothetical protein Thal_0046 [Thermocrinis albus DSM 14484]